MAGEDCYLEMFCWDLLGFVVFLMVLLESSAANNPSNTQVLQEVTNNSIFSNILISWQSLQHPSLARGPSITSVSHASNNSIFSSNPTLDILIGGYQQLQYHLPHKRSYIFHFYLCWPCRLRMHVRNLQSVGTDTVSIMDPFAPLL